MNIWLLPFVPFVQKGSTYIVHSDNVPVTLSPKKGIHATAEIKRFVMIPISHRYLWYWPPNHRSKVRVFLPVNYRDGGPSTAPKIPTRKSVRVKTALPLFFRNMGETFFGHNHITADIKRSIMIAMPSLDPWYWPRNMFPKLKFFPIQLSRWNVRPTTQENGLSTSTYVWERLPSLF